MRSDRAPGERAGLHRTQIVQAARALLDERGARGLAMRSVAERLGVAPNALYSHVDGKAGLIDAVLDDLIGEIPVPPDDLEDRAAVTVLMRDSFDALVRHPDLVALSLARQGSSGENAWRLGDVLLTRFASLGLSDAAARDGLRILLVQMMGFAAFATQFDDRLSARAPHDVSRIRADYLTALDWCLDGILAAS